MNDDRQEDTMCGALNYALAKRVAVLFERYCVGLEGEVPGVNATARNQFERSLLVARDAHINAMAALEHQEVATQEEILKPLDVKKIEPAKPVVESDADYRTRIASQPGLSEGTKVTLATAEGPALDAIGARRGIPRHGAPSQSGEAPTIDVPRESDNDYRERIRSMNLTDAERKAVDEATGEALDLEGESRGLQRRGAPAVAS